MPATDRIRGLDALIEAATTTAQDLVQVLDAERLAIRSRDREALERLTADKQVLVAQLERAGAEQMRLVEALGIGTVGAELGSRLRSAGLAHTAAGWQRLAALLDRCRSLNRSNGQAINASRRATERLVDLLQGRDGSQRLYGPRGETPRGGSLGYLAKA